MTPKDFDYAVDAFNKNIEMQRDLELMHKDWIEYQSWLTGLYVYTAIGAAFGGKKGRSYPNKPFTDKSDSIEEIAKKNGKTEEELNAELLYMTLRIKEVNSRLENM